MEAYTEMSYIVENNATIYGLEINSNGRASFYIEIPVTG